MGQSSKGMCPQSAVPLADVEAKIADMETIEKELPKCLIGKALAGYWWKRKKPSAKKPDSN